MSAEKDDTNLITRGTSAQRGLSIESQGKIWARKKAADMLAGLENSVLIVRDTDEYRRRLELPPLTGEEEIIGWGVRINRVGNIYTPIWRVKDTKLTEDGGRQLVNPKDEPYRVMNRAHTRTDYFNNLPKDLPVHELIILKVDSDIESAIRLQRHILTRYQPRTEAKEAELARRVVEKSDSLANRYISEERPVTEADLMLLGKKTEQFLEQENLIDPRDPEKQQMMRMLSQVNVKDSLGRINPLVARVRARAAYLAATRRLVVGGMVTRKFASNEQVLLYERENTRWAMQTAYSQLGSVLRHADFGNPDGSATLKQRAAIANILMHISEGHLALPRVKAYLAVARFAAISLTGCREIKKAENREILGNLAGELFLRKPTRILIIDGKFSEAKERINEARKAIIDGLG